MKLYLISIVALMGCFSSLAQGCEQNTVEYTWDKGQNGTLRIEAPANILRWKIEVEYDTAPNRLAPNYSKGKKCDQDTNTCEIINGKQNKKINAGDILEFGYQISFKKNSEVPEIVGLKFIYCDAKPCPKWNDPDAILQELTLCPDRSACDDTQYCNIVDCSKELAKTLCPERCSEDPVTEAPATDAPATEAPATEAPATEAPATEAPATEAPEGGLVCQSDDECKTEAEMGAGWGSFFADQPNAPCLDMTNFGMDGMMCFTSTGGSLKPCSCWDPNEEFDNEWCNTGRFGDDHTMCIYEEGAQEACGEVSVAGITSQELKDSIVSKHNELRAKVANGQEEQGVDGAQPKAANMMELVWSDELAEVAQRWVDQCAGAHDDNRRTEKFSSVGQNWAARYGGNHDDSSELADKMVENWYNEVADITLQAVNSYSSDQAVTGSTGVIGHYTQVVWAETAEVGCGYMTSFVNDRLESVLVCNYGPGGNWLGNAVYEQGEPGSNCPTGTSATSAGLCA